MRAFTAIISLPRCTRSSTVSPAGITPRRARSSAAPRTRRAFSAVTTSPLRRPACAAGAFVSISAIAAPSRPGRPLPPAPEPAAPHFAEADQLPHHRAREMDRHREADADVAAGGPDDRAVDAHPLPLQVDERAPRGAGVDRRG